MPYESTITFTLDTICPWTYLGFTHLLKALAQYRSTNPNSPVTFTLRLAPYQLYPDFSEEGVSKYEWYKTEKYQNSEARMNMYIDYMTALGKDDDIAFEFREGMIANTFHAHRILHHIQDHYSASAALAALQSLYSQYFEQGQHPSSASTLTKACLAAGLDEDDARNLVGDEEMQARETREAIREQVGNAVDSVPSVVFEGRKRDFTMVEAKSTEEYEKVMRQVEKEAM